MWLVQYKDSYSRLRLSRGYAATGESAIMGIDFLNFVWNRDEDEHPVRYLPVNFKSDNGAFEKRAEVRAMFDALTVERKRSRPHNKDSNQKVETGWKILWRKFELPLAMDLIDANIKTITLSDYNDLLHEFLTREQFESHPSLGTSKGEVYRQSIMTYPPREIDIDLREIACRVEHRSVKQDLIVRYQNEDYEAPLYAMDQRIRIYKNMAGELMGELIEEDRKPFLLKPYRVRDYDDFENRPHRTYRQEREQILKSKEREAKQGNKAAEVSFQEGKRIFMKPETNEAVPNSPFTESDVASDAFGSVYAAKVYIGSQLPDGQTYKDVAFAFDDMLLITTSKQAINTVLAELNHKPKMRALK
jgi:biotin carboxyl carrier protein